MFRIKNLNLIAKINPNQRVLTTIKKGSEFRLLFDRIHKKGDSYYLCGSLIVSTKFFH